MIIFQISFFDTVLQCYMTFEQLLDKLHFPECYVDILRMITLLTWSTKKVI